MKTGLLVAAVVAALPAGYWTREKAAPLLERTLTLRLAPDTSRLGPGEKAALARLLEVGAVMQELYEESRHHQALAARERLDALASSGAAGARELQTLYRLFQGPVATTLENKRETFLPVDAVVPGKNVYPWGVTREEVDAWLARNAGARAELMAARTVVRRDTADNRRADLALLAKHPALDTLHPGLRARLQAPPAAGGFYAVPYALAYADRLLRAHRLLSEAADAVAAEDAEI
ncbi:MAG TPA: NUDIX hydrolase, partial [Vicinamibacteria bacterium]|nr:NUDIX hydrolase [Vicinamibacteria bacterium]